MGFKKGIIVGVGIGAGIVITSLIIIGLSVYQNEPPQKIETEQKINNEPKSLISEDIFKNNDDSRRKELEQMAQINPVVKGLITGVIKIYVEPIPNYASDGVSEGIDAILNELEKTQIEQLHIQRVYDPNEGDIYISWVKDYGSHTLGEAIFKSHIKIGLGASNCIGEWQPFDAHTVTLVFWHELGHSLGFNHSNDPNNIMYYQTPMRFSVDYDNTITLDEGQAKSIPFCLDDGSTGTFSYSANSNSDSNGFLIYVLTPGTSPQLVLDGRGQVYTSCSGNDSYKSFSNTCTVANGASLMVYNKDDLLQFSAINVNIQIKDIGERITPNMEWDASAFEYDEAFLEEVYRLYH
jgi:hypothetical protein